MDDSSSALRQLARASRLETFATAQFTSDRGSDEVLNADVVLACPNLEALDQRAGQLGGQWLDWFVSFDTRARHAPRIRRHTRGTTIRKTVPADPRIGLLVCQPAKHGLACGGIVNGPEVAMLHTAPIESAVDDLEQRGPGPRTIGPGPRTIGAGLVVATLLTVVYAGQPQVRMMPVLAMIAVAAAVIDARTLRIPNWLTATGAFLFAVLAAHLVVVENHAWQPIAIGVVIMAGPLFVAHLVSRSRTPGLGDVKLAAVLGVPLGAVSPGAAYWALLLALMIGAGYGLVHQRSTKLRVFPLGPAISLASVLTAFAFGLSSGDSTWLL
jgi:leader peptidase (prepilin peptidase) / N-methyltransferase